MKKAPKKNPIAGGINDGRAVRPNSFCFSTASIAGDKRDQKLAAIMTPPVKPREASSNFRFADLKKKTNPAPTAVRIQVNNPAQKACNIGSLKPIKKFSSVVEILSIIVFGENNKTNDIFRENVLYLQ